MTTSHNIDETDRRILRELDTDPRLPVALLAQRLGLARGTVYARLAKLERTDALLPNSARLRPAALGRSVIALLEAEVDQRRLMDAIAALEKVPEVLDCYAPAGEKDLLMRVVAVDADDLYRVTEAVRLCPRISRTQTSVYLRELIPFRMTFVARRRRPRERCPASS